MTTDKIRLIREVGEEIIGEKELKALLSSGRPLVAYDGFEPSGQMHIAQGILRTITVNKMIKAGVSFKMLVADWHAMANKKLGGDLEKIKTVGNYFIEIWKACGMNLDKVEFIWASDLVKDPDYWKLVLRIAGTNSYKRFIRTAEIMGRAEDENITGAQIIYSCMQTADIFTLGAQITQLGLDQRKINVLAREVGPQLGYAKPVIISHHMLRGLQKPAVSTSVTEPSAQPYNFFSSRSYGQNDDADSFATSKVRSYNIQPHEHALGDKKSASNYTNDKLQRTIELKMSKSHPDSAIFMTDSTDDLKRKIAKAYCPPGITEENPILEYCRYILFEHFGRLTIERPDKFGGDLTISSYQDLEELYTAKKIHPMDLKNVVVKLLDELIAPVRKHFQENPYAKQLLEQVQSFKITR